MSLVPQTYNITPLITSPKIPTDFLWGLSAFFIGLALIYLVSVFYFRNKITREGRRIREKKKELSPIVSEFLFYDENGDKIEKINYIGLKIEVRELIKNPFDRKVLTEILMDLRKDVSGNTRSELFDIYQDLGLHEDAYKKLKSWRWQIISKGIFELTQMHVEEAYKPITRFINDKRGTVRKQAEIAVVTLKNEGISFFLDHTKYRISEWQQLKLLDVVRNKENYLPPAFRLWLTSKNNHVVLFALRLIKHFNQNDAKDSLITLLYHRNNHIKREAIHCIKEFYVMEALPVLKQIFTKSNADIKMHILDAISEIGSEEDITFLKDIEKGTDSFMVKNKAIRAINTIKPETILPSKDIERQPENALVEQSEIYSAPVEEHSDQECLNEDSDNVISESQIIEQFDEVEQEEIEVFSADQNVEAAKQENSLEKAMDFDDPQPENNLENDDLSFLPLVTDNIIEEINQSAKNEEPSYYGLDVVFESVIPQKTTPLFDLNFLPVVTLKRIEKTIDPWDLEVFFEIVAPIKKETPKRIDEIEVCFEIVREKPSLFEENLLDFSELNKPHTEDEKIEKSETHNSEIGSIEWPLNINDLLVNIAEVEGSLPEEEDFIEAEIPKPKFPDHLETIALLENIEELGDEREIPLLKSMLENEFSVAVKERIGFLLDKFVSKEIDILEKPVTLEKEYSVFEELFEKADLESKLFLLDEIATLGDSKELYLLHNLIANEGDIVREKALKVLNLVEQGLEETSITNSPNTQSNMIVVNNILNNSGEDFFDLNFEPSGEIEKPSNKGISKKNRSDSKDSLFDHLCNISTKFYNKK